LRKEDKLRIKLKRDEIRKGRSKDLEYYNSIVKSYMIVNEDI